MDFITSLPTARLPLLSGVHGGARVILTGRESRQGVGTPSQPLQGSPGPQSGPDEDWDRGQPGCDLLPPQRGLSGPLSLTSVCTLGCTVAAACLLGSPWGRGSRSGCGPSWLLLPGSPPPPRQTLGEETADSSGGRGSDPQKQGGEMRQGGRKPSPGVLVTGHSDTAGLILPETPRALRFVFTRGGKAGLWILQSHPPVMEDGSKDVSFPPFQPSLWG